MGDELIGGRYQLGEFLGRGGMAEVRKGTDTRLGRSVAIKRLRTDLASDATFQARFRREAQSSASLNHPAIVAVYDTGEEWDERDNVAQPYIVMEYVAGRTLRDILKEGRKILPERALEITSGVLAALDYSHRAGIIHRDIKPGNVMLTPTGDVKVMDFGIARAVSDAASTMTQTAAVVGTAQYLSPEQARGETVDARSDLYSTGCLLYELLAGRPPFVGDSPVAVAYQHVREPAVPPSDHDTEISEELDAIVLKALSKRLEDRYQSAAAMRHDIERYLAGHPVTAVTQIVPAVAEDDNRTRVAPVVPAVAGAGAAGAAGSGAARDDRDDDRDTSGRAGWLIAGLLLLALIGLAAWMLPKMFDDPAPEKVQVPNVIDKTEVDARQILGGRGFRVTTEYVEDDTAKKDVVIDQDPVGTFEEEGTLVTLTVSAGKPLVQIPYSVIGQPKGQVEAQLKDLKLVPVLKEKKSDAPADEVIELNPAPGQEVPVGSEVTVFFSDGPSEVPNVIGKKEGEAKQILSDAGFRPKVVYTETPDKPTGVVTDQSPDGGSAPDGSEVTIIVNNYVEPSETPTPTPTESDTDADGDHDTSDPHRALDQADPLTPAPALPCPCCIPPPA